MNIYKIFLSSDYLGKFVFLLLLVLSIISWSIIINRLLYFYQNMRMVSNALQDMQAGEEVFDNDGVFADFQRLYKAGNVTSAKVQLKERVASVYYGMSYLSAISSSAPFIGLFGTVWGIVKCFHVMGSAGVSNIANIAPAISESLVATAAGLFVALPAYFFYNIFIGKAEELILKLESGIILIEGCAKKD